MKLEQYHKAYCEMAPGERIAFLREYRQRRFLDIQNYSLEPAKKTKKRVSKKVKKPKVILNAAEKALLANLNVHIKGM